jgi:uncharacterized paraquat-inducible protein A
MNINNVKTDIDVNRRIETIFSSLIALWNMGGRFKAAIIKI